MTYNAEATDVPKRCSKHTRPPRRGVFWGATRSQWTRTNGAKPAVLLSCDVCGTAIAQGLRRRGGKERLGQTPGPPVGVLTFDEPDVLGVRAHTHGAYAAVWKRYDVHCMAERRLGECTCQVYGTQLTLSYSAGVVTNVTKHTARKRLSMPHARALRRQRRQSF